MKIKKYICSLELEGSLDDAIRRLCDIKNCQEDKGFTGLVIDEVYGFGESSEYEIFGLRDETTKEKEVRKAYNVKQKEDEIAMLKSLRKRYPNE